MNTISQRVMASVAMIYIARTIFGATALKVYALLISIWGIGRLAWVSKVAENFFAIEKSGTGSVAHFLLVAIEHAQLGVQAALIIAALAIVSLFFDVTRAAPRGRSLAA